MMLFAALSAHIYIVIVGAPEIFWIVDQQTAYISAGIEFLLAIFLGAIGFWKGLVALHDRPRKMKDLFRDEYETP